MLNDSTDRFERKKDAVDDRDCGEDFQHLYDFMRWDFSSSITC